MPKVKFQPEFYLKKVNRGKKGKLHQTDMWCLLLLNTCGTFKNFIIRSAVNRITDLGFWGSINFYLILIAIQANIYPRQTFPFECESVCLF